MKDFSLSKKQEKKIIQAIQLAEQNTSGEIRVHIDAEPNGNHLDIAAEVFMALKMDQTRDRNGVLFHVSPKDHNFTVIGDIGITAVVPDDFWEEIKEAVIKKFKKENYVKGLIKGIEMAGTALQKYFPYKDDDKNELPDEISWG
ncbi:MAG: TPM domain-containing protein [Flavobacteriaceae bacterium]|nr:TPM domain-containing protein [Flavobacteriaceae bacterium]